MQISTLIQHMKGMSWFKDEHLQYRFCNDQFKNLIGFKKETDYLDKSDDCLPWHAFARAYQTGDQVVIKNKKPLKFIHPIKTSHGKELLIVSQKELLAGGILGNITIIANHKILEKITNWAIKDKFYRPNNQPAYFQYTIDTSDNILKFSTSELKCIFYLIRGFTAKEMGERIFKSSRTIEKIIDTIKIKTKCDKKSELIALLIDLGYLDYFPFT